ncbi:ImmA/IrrE family metallo-endopeptidase [Limosilactobacillus sp.]|jgi:Zn-dependent peptidase ImmA (M78 family)|uniref:ImmA/IrrE family metallo-endopeptidase n=1 Tax=Limosilactobacillus sp. TaxID=2773925 RepID=UPI0025BE6D59|nr:ImmA/IrrE family metallo-endopeptidase [Limosilactobacillus sp.]MCH3922348.1 ImmA/IrrE family metallo-endopeptidase [Limosilactobacillus sp.]MCH3929120.1 ImmA/IrrE family metallo-endopeptidase [Limosilactobacillus sp.]
MNYQYQVEEARDYLQERADEYHIKVQWAHLSPITPPGSSYEYRSVVMNYDWHHPREIIFQFAHELAHVIHGDPGDVVYYHASFTGKESVEYKANVGAVKLLVPFYCQETDRELANSANFMRAFDVPGYLTNVVTKEIAKMY